MMVEARQNDDEMKVAHDAASFARLADASARLFAGQAATMAVMTAYGMSVASQMTGMMLGALSGPAAPIGGQDASDEAGAAPDTSSKVVSFSEPGKPKAVKPAPRAAAKKKSAKAGAAKVTAAEDLKNISGIGPRLEKALNERGIRRYADIASLSKAALKKIDAELGLEGRVMRDDWAGQARALSGGNR